MSDMLISTSTNLPLPPSPTLSPHTLLEVVQQTVEMLDQTSTLTVIAQSLIPPCQTLPLTQVVKTLPPSLPRSLLLPDLVNLSTPTRICNNLQLPVQVQPCLLRMKTSISFPKFHLTMSQQEGSSEVVSYPSVKDSQTTTMSRKRNKEKEEQTLLLRVHSRRKTSPIVTHGGHQLLL